MSLITCIECKKEISDKSEYCPHCGCPTIESKNAATEKIILDKYRDTIIELRKNYKCSNRFCDNTQFNIELFAGIVMSVCTKCGNHERIAVYDQSQLNDWLSKNNNPNQPHCPYCGSTNLKKIGVGSRLLSVGTLGLAGNKIGKQWHCNSCKSNF